LIKNHSWGDGHSPVPMGCTCGYANPPPPKKRNLRRTRQVWSGVCVCGHSADHHHGNMVMNIEAIRTIGPRFAGECEAYGCNEWWKPCPKCPGNFVDREDPLRELKLLDSV
jgi:hypothetical protein